MSSKHNVKKYAVRLLLAGVAVATLAVPVTASAHVVRGRIAKPSGRINGRIAKPPGGHKHGAGGIAKTPKKK